MFHRHLTDALRAAAAANPAVTLTGPRQSGKTTLVRAVFPDHLYLSLEAPDVRQRAIEDPRGFLAQGDRLVLDEIQRAPDLLSYIQVAVDADSRPGRFILTGSQDVLLLASVSQTLAGRTAFLRLYPLSLAERRGAPPLDVAQLDRLDSTGTEAGLPPASLWETLVQGFYPRIHDRNLVAREWLADYLSAYIERDLREVAQVGDLRGFERFVRLAAAQTGRELNLTALASDVGVTQQTAKRWLTALEIGYLATTLPPHHVNYRKRLRKRPRLHFLDTGLICYLLDIRDATMLANHPLRGAIFESFVVAEFIKNFAAARQNAPLYFWRDATGHEIDILIDAGQRLIPVEVKSGQTVAPDALNPLTWWTALPGNPNTGGVLVHGGVERYSYKGVQVVPWFLA